MIGQNGQIIESDDALFLARIDNLNLPWRILKVNCSLLRSRIRPLSLSGILDLTNLTK